MSLSDPLFQPGRIGSLSLSNRLVRSATWEGMATAEGAPTPELIELYRRLAEGGVGLIVTGFVYVSAEGRPLPGCLGLDRDELVQPLRNLTATVHQAGGRIAAQLGHAGGQTRSQLCGGRPLAPSALDLPQFHPETPAALNAAEIDRIIAAFAGAARRAKACGFDAVQLHAAHGYLLNQFLSPHSNRRGDGYGGGIERRSRLLFEVYRAVRREVGRETPLLVKLNVSDNLEGGLSCAEGVWVAQQLSEAGIDAIEVSAGTPASGASGPVRREIDEPGKEAYNLALAEAVRRVADCPLILVGGLRSHRTARHILRGGQVDYLALSRPLVCEPDLPRRWSAGEEAARSLCSSCNGCFKAAFRGGLRCVAQPAPAAPRSA